MDTTDISLLDTTTLRIAGAINESIVDGPGIRYVVFTQGCLLNCKGCHNPQARPLDGGIEVKLRVLYDEIKENSLVDGVTFSGGEPFLHPEPLYIFANILKSEGYNLWSYSGYTFEKIIQDKSKLRFLSLLDVLVDGPFIEDKKSLELDFRGSSNQRIIDVQKSLKQNSVVLMDGFR
ncbi:MAG: anaerobic ribonucleoside-triphosphate reductase activating protein [Succinivibrio sp.]